MFTSMKLLPFSQCYPATRRIAHALIDDLLRCFVARPPLIISGYDDAGFVGLYTHIA